MNSCMFFSVKGKSSFLIISFAFIILLPQIVVSNGDEDKAHKQSQKRELSKPQQDNWWKKKAADMVREQISKRGVQDEKVLEVMRNTPRHRFVPERYTESAYSDSPLPIGQGQTISQPYIVGLMTSLLDLSGDEKVLEIGTGSGYQAAILAQLTDEVYTIEVIKELANTARERLQTMDFNNVHVKWGDGYQGWPEHASFDRIIVTAAPDKIPSELIKQLNKGGKMVLPVGRNYQVLKVVKKTADGRIKKESVTGVRFVPMIHPDEPINSGDK
mgnify:CR=1 FL=1